MNLTMLRRRTLPAPDQTAADPVPGPPSVEIAARHLRVGDDYAATLAVTGYPAEVAPGWLEPLLSYPGRLDVALHIDPVPPAAAADRLRRQRARLESGRRAGADRGQLDDPDTEWSVPGLMETLWFGTPVVPESLLVLMVTQRRAGRYPQEGWRGRRPEAYGPAPRASRTPAAPPPGPAAPGP